MTYYKAIIEVDFEAANDLEAESISLVLAAYLNRCGEAQGTLVQSVEEIPEDCP